MVVIHSHDNLYLISSRILVAFVLYMNLSFGFVNTLTLPFPSLLVPTPSTKGVEPTPPPSYLKNRCPHESEILQGIRDTFESLRNVKVVYMVFTWLL